MAARPTKVAAPKKPQNLIVVFGEDDYRVERAARRALAEFFPEGEPEMGVEVVEGRAANQTEALRSLDRVMEALNTYGFFSKRKAVWWKNTNLLADNVTARAAAVGKRLAEIVEYIKGDGISSETLLIVTADGVDARKSFYKHADQAGRVISFKNERPEEIQAEAHRFVGEQLKELEVGADPRAVNLLLVLSDGEFRVLKSELEKLAAYVGARGTILEEHVRLLASARQDVVVWDLTGAFDRRDLSRALQILDQLRYQQEEPVGLLFALISHVRQLLFLRELLDLKVLQPAQNPGHLIAQISRIPAQIRAQMPQEKKWNPLLGNPYAVFHRLAGAGQYSSVELHRAMRILLECNEKLVTSGIEFDWLENALLKILTGNSDVSVVGNAVE